MGSGKSLIDQIQDALRGMEESGFLDELADQAEVEDDAQEKATPPLEKPDAPHSTDGSSP